MKKKKNSALKKQKKETNKKASLPMIFEEAMTRIAKVKPPKK
jgi:hypothetical protein